MSAAAKGARVLLAAATEFELVSVVISVAAVIAVIVEPAFVRVVEVAAQVAAWKVSSAQEATPFVEGALAVASWVGFAAEFAALRSLA
jgi:hypothetical protein